MGKKLDELDRLTKAAENHRSEIQEKINSRLAQKAEYHSAAESAAAGGDVDKFVEMTSKEHDVDARIYVFRKQMDSMGSTISESDVVSAWAEFEKEYNKTFDREWKEYIAARKELYEKFMRICDMQNDALKRRERCAQLIGDTTGNRFTMTMIPGSVCQGLLYKGMNISMPDAIFFMACGVANDATANYFNTVIRNQKPF